MPTFVVLKLSGMKTHELLTILLPISGVIILLVILLIFYFNKQKMKRRLDRMNQRLAQQADKLRIEQEKNEKTHRMKTTLIQSMHEELQTKLNTIVSTSTMLKDIIKETPEEISATVEAIEKNSDNLLKIIEEMVTIDVLGSDEHPSKSSLILLDECCWQCVKSMQHNVASGVHLYFSSIPENSVKLLSDRDDVIQVISNLLDNACKFTKLGEIELSYETADTENGKVARIFVRDTGPGIPPREAENIFKRFYKLNEKVVGDGLGLPLCRILANRHGGNVLLDMTYTKGSRFIFTLPLHE